MDAMAFLADQEYLASKVTREARASSALLASRARKASLGSLDSLDNLAIAACLVFVVILDRRDLKVNRALLVDLDRWVRLA